MQLFFQPGIPDGKLSLDSEESGHCIRVLRKKRGDIIDITDGKGWFYQARITRDDSRECEFQIISKKRGPSENYYIHIAIAPTKNIERLEWFIEKCTEIGINEVSFIICQNSERQILKTSRLIKKTISAMKQSVKATLPVINEPQPFQMFIKSVDAAMDKFIACVDPDNPVSLYASAVREKKYCILIGPEGDFTAPEIKVATDSGYRKVNLGRHILRTETAGIVACHTLNLINN